MSKIFRFSSISVQVVTAITDKLRPDMLSCSIPLKVAGIYTTYSVCVCEFKLSYVLRTLFFQCLHYHLSIGWAELRKICSYFDPNRMSSVILRIHTKLNFRLKLERGIMLLKRSVLTFLRFIF